MPENQQVQQSTESKSNAQKQVTTTSPTQASNPYFIIQRAKINPKSLTHADIMQLQRTIGNRAVGMLLSSIRSSSTSQQATVQRQEIPEEEESLQGKMAGIVQRQDIPDEDEPVQGKFAESIQLQEIPEPEEEEPPLQGKFENKPEQETCPSCSTLPIQRETENRTGMPDDLKAGVESLSGMDMSDVRVNYNSSKPAEVGALAYTQGTNIHVAPGQERHLPHEAWHVVQQAQGRVRPTTQLKDGVPVNDDEGLEHEADVMGGREAVGVVQATGGKARPEPVAKWGYAFKPKIASQTPIQRTLEDDLQAIGNYADTTEDPLLKAILQEVLATRRQVKMTYGYSAQKSHMQPIGEHGKDRGYEVVIDQNQYINDEERQSIIVHELLHASSDSKYKFNEKYNESALTTPLRGDSREEADAFAGKQFRFARLLAEQLREEAERERRQLGDEMTDHVIDRANRIAGANTQEFDSVVSELLYFMRKHGVNDKTKTFRKVRNMAEAAYNARNRDIPITEGYVDSDSFKKSTTKSACFLTTACAYVHGLSDDCEELTVLRNLRDGYMRERAEDEVLIDNYYKMAPVILDGIMKDVDRVQILRGLYGTIRRCVRAVKCGHPEHAVQIYRVMVERLQRTYV